MKTSVGIRFHCTVHRPIRLWPALFRHSRHVHSIPFLLHLQLDKDKGECLTYPFVSSRMYNFVPY